MKEINIGKKKEFVNFLPFYDITYIHCLEYKGRRISKPQIQSIIKQMKDSEKILNKTFSQNGINKNHRKNYIIVIYGVDKTKNLYDYVTKGAYQSIQAKTPNITREIYLDFVSLKFSNNRKNLSTYIKESEFRV